MVSVVREFGYISVTGQDQGLDYVTIPRAAFLDLKNQALNWPDKKATAFQLKNYKGNECLQVQNYVGLIQTQDGHQLEILPKISREDDSTEHLRNLLRDMLTAIYSIKPINVGSATLGTLPHTWLESLMEMFLEEVNLLVHKGIKKHYQRTSEEARFQKGQLFVTKQLRKSPNERHLFSIHYDHYTTNRPENRLIHLALLYVSKLVNLPKNQRLTRELLLYFSDIPISENPNVDMSNWSNQRDMVLYRTLKPWVELILKNESPIFSTGPYKGLSLLFPMQQLFEEYVSLLLRRQLNQGYNLTAQASSQYLVQHKNSKWFCLKPDILIKKSQNNIAVLDTKWKLLDSHADDTKMKYKISQSDLYQLFAYGKKYLNGGGCVFLIYPAHQNFKEPLPVFDFDENLKLWVVPFDLDKRCLVSGLWQENVKWLRDDCTTRLESVVNQ